LILENHEFDVETMIDDFVTFFVAGEETTSSMLASLFLELGRNELVLEKYTQKRIFYSPPEIN
jgi:cholesterol 24(S)-hydroxylase